MTNEPIRILVDTSRDTGWSDGLIRIEPDNIYQTTNNRDYLSEAVLRNYDVLTICSNTQLKYTDAELQLIRDFVEEGGGLLLATSTSRFERDVRENVSELGVNDIASLFGARFILLPEGQGEMDADAHPLRGYVKDSLCLTNHEITDGLEIDDLGITYCGIIDLPKDASIFLEHSETGEAIGACLSYGSGRVLLINTQLFQKENHFTSTKFIDWLGINRVSSKTENQTIPDEIPIEEHVREDENIKIYYTHFVADRVDTCMAFAKILTKEMFSKFPDGEKIEWKIDLNPSCVHGYGYDWVAKIGGCVSPPIFAYILGVEATELIVDKTPFGNASSVMFDGFQFFFGIWGMKLLGFESEAEEMLAETERQFRENAAVEELVDIARIYDKKTRKHIWILKKFLGKYGDDLFVKLAQLMSENQNDIEKNMPRTTFSWIDTLIYYLSRTVGEDLFPWFEEIGTTVQPIPLLANHSDEFVAEIRAYLNGIIRDTTAETSDRIDAINSLWEIADETEQGISALVAKLNSTDRYEQLIGAVKLIKTCDDRAVKVIEELADEEGDDGLVAISLLLLVHSGQIKGNADQLVEIASYQDDLYQLETGHLLSKSTHPASNIFPSERLTDKDGAPILTMDVECDRDLYLYAIIDGYRVATCNTIVHTHHFPHNTHVPGTYVRWLHTRPKHRRKGLARCMLSATLSHELVKRYSCISLHTGSHNTAHGMYRSFGFVDGLSGQQFTKTLQQEHVKEIEGLIVRPYTPGDEVAMAKVLNTFYADLVERRPRRAERRRTTETRLIYLTEMDGELLGYLQVLCFEKHKDVWISEFGLLPKPTEDSNHSDGIIEEVGTVLLYTLHNELVKREYQRISWGPEAELEKKYVRKLFHNCGYASTDASWVWMFKIINLPMLLRELTPLLTKRLNESEAYKYWQGTIAIIGRQHQASLIIKESVIQISEEVSENAGISLSTDDDTVTRFILGVITPFEAYLQNQLDIVPTVNSLVTGLLDTLFPSK